LEELRAVTDETHGWGRKVACHAYNGLGLQAPWMAVATRSSTALK
jgi:hypothetical protein